MSVSEKQTLEIIKILYRGVDTLVLDEPTAVLTPQEIKHLFDIIRNMKKDGKTIIKTGARIDTMNAGEFEKEISSLLHDGGIDLEMDCSDLTYMASSGLRIIQKTMRTVMQLKGQFKITNVAPEIYKVLTMTGFTKFMRVEQK
jgi:anti-anti-sigma factor